MDLEHVEENKRMVVTRRTSSVVWGARFLVDPPLGAERRSSRAFELLILINGPMSKASRCSTDNHLRQA